MQQPGRPPFDPYAPPAPEVGPFREVPGDYGYGLPAPRVDGKVVTLAKAYPIPPRCMKCASPVDLRGRTQAFSWYPRWTNFLLLVGLLPAVIVQSILTKRASLNLPLCSSCDGRWTKAVRLRRLAFAVPLVVGLSLVTIGVVFAKDAGLLGVLGFLIFFPGILVVIPIEWLMVRPRTLRALFIDDQFITLQGVAPATLDALRSG